jgi:hypothetical protein
VEKAESVDQRRARVLAFLAGHAEALCRGGSVQQSWRYRGGRRLGPFFRLAYREGAKQCSLYLGRDPALAGEVRAALRQLQAPLRQQREADHRLAEIRAELRQQRRALDGELAQRGLRRKGSEIRGWRTLKGPPREPPGV